MRTRAWESVLFELAFAALAVGCVWPLWSTRYAPLQDLPQHLATIRVLHDYHDPKLGFFRYYDVDLLRTQYLAYYLIVDLLAYFSDVGHANELVLCASMVATPYAARALLRALGKDERMAVLCFGLSYNAHLLLGFFNFLAAIPLCLYGVALGVRQRRGYTPLRAVGLSLVALLCFYTHVVPFGLLCAGVALCAMGPNLRGSARLLAPLVPPALAALLWLKRSPAGQATLTAAAGAQQGPQPTFMPAAQAIAQLPIWLTDVLAGERDRQLLWAWAGLCALALLLALAERGVGRLRRRARAAAEAERASGTPSPRSAWSGWVPDALAFQLSGVMWLLAVACAVGYFVAPTSYDWIWPIGQRFPLLCALFLVIALPSGRLLRRLLLVAAFVVCAASERQATTAFQHFDRDEVGDFDAALAVIPVGRRVVGLIFDKYSHNVGFAPFIHFAAYYQARKGGVVMFTFADFPQSPVRFKPDARPPPVPPRWEWLPERVRPIDLSFYDYALVRGGPGVIAQPGSGFVPRYRGMRWSVFERRLTIGEGTRGSTTGEGTRPPRPAGEAVGAPPHRGVRFAHLGL